MELSAQLLVTYGIAHPSYSPEQLLRLKEFDNTTFETDHKDGIWERDEVHRKAEDSIHDGVDIDRK